MRRRDVLKILALGAVSPLFVTGSSLAAPFLKGINAYYLHQELYERAAAKGFKNLGEQARDYLEGGLGFPELQRTCGINAVRFWAFNHYPCQAGPSRPSSPACTVLSPGKPNQPALDVLAALLDALDALGLAQVPVLSNYWMSYGGVVAMLEWGGIVPAGTFETTFCGLERLGGNELLHAHSMDFYTKPAMLEVWRQAVGPVLGVLAGRRHLAVVELINEPRGLFPKGFDPAEARAAVAAWLRRQGDFVRGALGDTRAKLSSGEEGWLAAGPPDGTTTLLRPGGEPWEGIDMVENVRQGGMDAASVHCYLHPNASLTLKNLCNVQYTDTRGWDFLMREASAPVEAYVQAGREWIVSRAKACGAIPWYLGEFGWTRPGQDKAPLAATALREERTTIYAAWLDAARTSGAFGAFVWMADSPEHQDTFYGLDKKDLQRCFAS